MQKKRHKFNLTREDKKFLKICADFHKFREKNPEFEIWKKIKKETKFEDKKIARIKSKLMNFGTIDKNYFINRSNLDKIKVVIKEDEEFSLSFSMLLSIGMILIIIISLAFLNLDAAYCCPGNNTNKLDLNMLLLTIFVILGVIVSFAC